MRVLGALGEIGRRQGVPVEENAVSDRFLPDFSSLLPRLTTELVVHSKSDNSSSPSFPPPPLKAPQLLLHPLLSLPTPSCKSSIRSSISTPTKNENTIYRTSEVGQCCLFSNRVLPEYEQLYVSSCFFHCSHSHLRLHRQLTAFDERIVFFFLSQIKKIDRKKFPELRLRADGALENLVGFVQYRKEILKPKPAGRR